MSIDRRQARANALGAATLGLTLAAVLASRPWARGPTQTALRKRSSPTLGPAPVHLAGDIVNADASDAGQDRSAIAATTIPSRTGEARAASQLYLSAAMLAASVLSDSAVEHYRGGYDNPGMFASLAGAALALAWAARGARHPGNPAPALPFGAACAIGAAGIGFHTYNVLHRPGGLSWSNLFYGAPLAAPAALSLAGLLGLAARATGNCTSPSMRQPSGRALCAIAAIGLAGTSVEAALLHFRGAYHHPAMWLPVALPPVGAALLAVDAMRPATRPRLLTRAWLTLCSWLGAAGTALHARGVARQMGGWRNWSQNLLSGPPLPAPPAFSALALAGQAALSLRTRDIKQTETP